MGKILAVAIALVAAALAVPSAHAQAYRWTDKEGHVQFGDVPPPGVQATPVNLPPTPPASSASSGQHPLTPAEEEQQFRKRQLEQQKEEQKAAEAQKESAAKKQNCADAQESLRALQSGQRIARVAANGERYYIDDAERARETERAQAAVSQWCN